MTWSEIKKAVEQAGVGEDEAIGVISVRTDGVIIRFTK